MKLVKICSLITLVSLLLVGCGSTPQLKSDEPAERIDFAEEEGYIVGLDQKSSGIYVFSIRNVGPNPMKLTFPTTKLFDYAIKNQAGETVYQYSYAHSFNQVITEKTIETNAAIEMEIYILEILETLEPGSYNLEVWLSANNLYATSEMEIVVE
ncbi:hypothetical protein DS745_12665 [Anaerobacillus alkaliphilus]|uniref:Intracellular proteinase inhibitor BsuPI domain-containing protein n=1 Tax=Anaerobacillus alkaliphilus TaxID=1548597 RepID=A0A4Q0VST1_9BACI|nr:BsuPI-related putative proteinase inhibitor [Anaerobacillus alkaliphilus]RXJ00377.1 hypothetical protein DS745_12665 [Anaerobacillus alkaliphilus]